MKETEERERQRSKIDIGVRYTKHRDKKRNDGDKGATKTGERER